jgi:hypothetical protein
MDKTILVPSPNWFQVSCLKISQDGWVVYGGPTKTLCILIPVAVEPPSIPESWDYRAHVFHKAHGDK